MRACRPAQGGNGVSRAEARAEGEAFLREYFRRRTASAGVPRNRAVRALPEGCGLAEGLRVVQAGVCAGSAARGRFVPAHHLFMAYGAQCANADA
ncbi:MAG: RsmF rRNA methyltransferase first C-terminal domain-containing protein [Ruthenibacterium lactatiformans]